MKPADTQFDVVIVGAGLAGLIQYRALEARGFTPFLIDPRDEAALRGSNGDRRATTLTAQSVESLGLPDDWLAEHGQRVNEMIVDGGQTTTLEPETSLRLESGAWVVSNNDLVRWLLKDDRLKGAFGGSVVSMNLSDGHRVLETQSGAQITARLVIAADGKNSFLRRKEGLQRHLRDFAQTALTGEIEHAEDHQGRAFQRFLPGGTLAFLPLPGNGKRSSFIWVEPTAKAKDFFALTPEILIGQMAERFGGTLGGLSVPDDATWGHYPLTAHHCERIVSDRLALIGEAAHSMLPLAGLGLNMTIKDVGALTDVLTEQRRHGLDLGVEHALEDYSRARRVETARVTALTTGLHDVLDKGPAPLRAVAASGLTLLDRFKPLKAMLEREANR